MSKNKASQALTYMAELPDFEEHLFVQLHEAPLDTFTFFSKLHTELRLQLWRRAIPQGRHVNIGRDVMCQDEGKAYKDQEGIISWNWRDAEVRLP